MARAVNLRLALMIALAIIIGLLVADSVGWAWGVAAIAAVSGLGILCERIDP